MKTAVHQHAAAVLTGNGLGKPRLMEPAGSAIPIKRLTHPRTNTNLLGVFVGKYHGAIGVVKKFFLVYTPAQSHEWFVYARKL